MQRSPNNEKPKNVFTSTIGKLMGIFSSKSTNASNSTITKEASDPMSPPTVSSTIPIQSERANLFKNSPEAWVEVSKTAQLKLAKCIKQDQSLEAIYAIAAEERHNAALTLRHDNPELFGQPRITTPDKPAYDMYTPMQIAGSRQAPGDISVFTAITQKVIPQLNDCYLPPIVHTTEFDVGTAARTITTYTASVDRPEYEYRSHSTKDPNELGVFIYSDTDLQRNPDTLPDLILVRWKPLDEVKRKEHFVRLNVLFDKIKQMNIPEVLAPLGELAYELSRMIPLQRGTAAVNEWLIKATLMTKGIDVTNVNLRINGLSFDIYAELQSDKNKYISDFSEHLKNQLGLQQVATPPHPFFPLS